MKYFIKGIGLGLALNLANRLCDLLFGFDKETLLLFSAIIFCIITTAFLLSDKVSNLLLCGFTGLFFMIFFEIFLFIDSWFVSNWLLIYYAGMYGSIAAIAIALIITVKKIKIFNFKKECVSMTNQLKIKLMLYAIISSLSFSYLVMPENAGISIPIFNLIQLICLWYMIPNKKKLILFIPIFIISLNSFISANTIWKTSNFFVIAILYTSMFINFSFKIDSFEFLTNIITSITSSISHFHIPFKWMLELNSEKAPAVKRIAVALIIAIPCSIMLVIILSSADMVFSLKTETFITYLSDYINLNTIFKIICGVIIGLFLFGAVFNSYIGKHEQNSVKSRFKGDLIIINILLVSILLVYTLFVIIQFKYLFAGKTLPDGLSYTEYARKGFFELLALTCVNIALILTIIKLTKPYSGKWLVFTKALCHYLCTITIILLISAFYRMILYTNDDGLTRLRFFVMGFLIFEAIGLFITFIYIAKPTFNIALVYTVIALIYYSLLNILPVDNIIAGNQIDKYLRSERTDIEYIFTLSADAAPAMKYLIDNTNDKALKTKVEEFIQTQTYSDIPERWQRYNLSTQYAKNILEK